MIKMRWFYFLTENQRIFLSTCKDLGVGGWGLRNPYGVRILNPLEIIGRSLKKIRRQATSGHGYRAQSTNLWNRNNAIQRYTLHAMT